MKVRKQSCEVPMAKERLATHTRRITILAVSWLPIWPLGEKKGMPSLYHTLSAFVRRGYDVHFVTCYPPVSWRFEDRKRVNGLHRDGINIYEFRMPFSKILLSMKKKLLPETSGYLETFVKYPMHLLVDYFLWIVFTICSVLTAYNVGKKVSPDVVYAFNEYAALAGYLLGKLFRVPNITRLFGTFLYGVRHSFGYKFRYGIAVSGFRVPSKYVVVANDGTKGDEVARLLNVEFERLRFWYNGVDFEMYDPNLDLVKIKSELGIPEHSKVVLSLCRLDKWKGVHQLIEVIPLVVKKHEDVTFLIVGEGAERKKLEKKSKELGIKNWVRFTGAVDRSTVKKILNLADIFVSLQSFSNLSNVFLEALVCGKCIITLDDGSTNQFIVNGFSGFYVEQNDLDSLADLIIKLIDNEHLRQKIGENARKTAHKMLETWESRGDKEACLVEDVVCESNCPVY